MAESGLLGTVPQRISGTGSALPPSLRSAHSERSPASGNFLLPVLQATASHCCYGITISSAMGELPPSAQDLLRDKPMQNDALCLGKLVQAFS